MTPLDVIKRTTGPQTTNGRRWEVQLSATPPGQWLELFKVSGDSSTKVLATRVTGRNWNTVLKLGALARETS